MSADRSRPARAATFVLLALAYAACEVAAYPDGRPRPFGVAFGAGTLLAAVAVSYLVPGPGPGRRPPRRATALVAAALGLPVLAEPLLRRLAGAGFPLEMQLVNGLRIGGLLLAGLSAWPRCRRLAGVVALFLTLFASAMGDQPAIPYLLVALAVAGGVWLVLDHRAEAAVSAAATGAEVERVGLRVPYREGLVFAVLLAAAGGMMAGGPRRVVLALGELMPTSGGTGKYDPHSRGGVNDGPEETAGDNAKTAGMVDSDMLIESQQPSLIDAVSDMFGHGQKPKPRKNDEQMIAAGSVRLTESHKTPENLRPNRPFETGRAGPKAAKPAGGDKARGLFEVEGRTPLHVRAVVYDTYDPDTAAWVEGRKPPGPPLTAAGGGWFAPADLRPADWYAADDRHQLKTAGIKENLAPTPGLLTALRVQRVDEARHYEWQYDGVVGFAGRKTTPAGVVVHTACRTADPAGLPPGAFAYQPPDSRFLAVPPGLEAVTDRAAAWAGDKPRGWPQVAAVLDRLRQGFAADRSAVPPAGHPAPVVWFLTDSRRGPDYLFATAAALGLRSLGYPTRVCLGFYAAPAAYDADTGHTPVKPADLHVWPEVLLADGHWLPVEPTPGYDVLPPLKPWSERLADAARAVIGWAGRHAAPLGFGAAALLAAVCYRQKLADLVRTLRWRLFPGPSWAAEVLGAVRLLEKRAEAAGRPRPPARTLAAWAADLGGADGRTELADLVGLAEWAAYAPGLPPPAAADRARAVCRAAVGRWTLTVFAGRTT